MPDGSRVARRALGLALVGWFILSCAPAQPVVLQTPQDEARPPIVLPTSTPSFRLTPSRVATPPPPSPTPTPPDTQRPSPLVWAGGEGCLTAFGPEGWQTFEFSGIVRDIAIDAYGNAILAPGLRICNGRLLRDLLPRAPGGEQDAVTIDPQGRIWVGYYGGIAVLEGGRWNLVPIEGDGSTRSKIVRDLAVDTNGIVWVATGQGLASYDGQGWRQHHDKAGPGMVAIQQLLIDRQGRLWVAHERGISVLQGRAWEHFSLDVVGLVRHLVTDLHGGIVAGSPDRGLLLLSGRQWQPFPNRDSALPGARITALAIDDLGRVWAGTREGLSVYSDGRWVTYTEANSGLADDQVSALALAGTVSAPLPTPGCTRYGDLAGQVTLHRRPVPGVRVALCPDLLVGQSFDDIPCAGTGYSRVTRTGVDGRYLFERVPLGHYAVAAEIEPGRWVTPMRVLSAMNYRVREGQTVVVDTIEGGE